MRHAIAILLIVHGLIHLMGFVKAFYLTDIRQQVLGISKPIGSLWLITFILFTVSLVLYLTNKKWFYIAFLAIILSQILIIMAWQDAKFGTIANIIILLVSLSALGNNQFQNMVDKEVTALLKNEGINDSKIITENNLEALPHIVRKWLSTSGVLGREKTETAYLEQRGQMKTSSEGKWMSFEAKQYFNINNASFVWCTNVKAMPFINLAGRDKLIDGEGAMLIKLASLFPVVNEKENPKINSGAMIRFLSEMCWFPSAALSEHISWQEMDNNRAKATLTYKEQSVSGIFSFTEKGDLLSFEANRYYGGSTDSKEEKWLIHMEEYKLFNGLKIPNKSKVLWKFEKGDFHWLTVEITDLKYNLQ
ncbi:DUF6544 family protein [Winogradskyella algicola]|uniref:DUF6544 family protein n=1 Tax=Winogradskyella algicola TaxID=2575815 RepID=UPI001107D8C2|nr:DUF6544 family protein [Winogradskyella algicola]